VKFRSASVVADQNYAEDSSSLSQLADAEA
jgi:hypothetical protein